MTSLYLRLDPLTFSRLATGLLEQQGHEAALAMPDPGPVLGIAVDDLPPDFRPLASLLVYSVRPLSNGREVIDEATSSARLAVASALTAWLWRDRLEAREGRVRE